VIHEGVAPGRGPSHGNQCVKQNLGEFLKPKKVCWGKPNNKQSERVKIPRKEKKEKGEGEDKELRHLRKSRKK